jgi:hypothetical protein
MKANNLNKRLRRLEERLPDPALSPQDDLAERMARFAHVKAEDRVSRGLEEGLVPPLAELRRSAREFLAERQRELEERGDA